MMNVYEASRKLLEGDSRAGGAAIPQEWTDYIRSRKTIYGNLIPGYVLPNMRSEAMWVLRSRCRSGRDVGVEVRRGDICWLDYGQTFNQEMGYQHFGLVLALCNHKALIVPMTSNASAYERAGDTVHPSVHLMRIGQQPGMNKPSTLFLNDIRFINTARILEIRAHIDPEGRLFQEVLRRVRAIITGIGDTDGAGTV